MTGQTVQAGSVTGGNHIKNPISLAHRASNDSPHVMLAGRGAEKFAAEQGEHFVTQDYFYTKNRWEELLNAKEEELKELGTVGAIALDQYGNLAAGTSTGGLTNKAVGRIGDSRSEEHTSEL